MPKINILQFIAGDNESHLELIRLDGNETAIIPFTAEVASVNLHYCQEPEIGGYVRCNGDDCVLCRIGKKKDQRLMLPVYLPASRAIGVLPVSPSLRPHALLPQLANVLKAGKPMVSFLTRERARFAVSNFELKKDMDGGESAIQKFKQKYETGEIDLVSIYPCIDNDQLAVVSEIAQLLELKGLAANADSKGA